MSRNDKGEIVLSRGEASIISQLLSMAGEKFGDHGCNDLPKDFYEEFEEEAELLNLAAALRVVNNSHRDPDETDEEFLKLAMHNDSILMSLMAGYLEWKLNT